MVHTIYFVPAGEVIFAAAKLVSLMGVEFHLSLEYSARLQQL